MGTGWRRAFCTTIPTNSSDSPVVGDAPPQSSGKRGGIFKTSTPRLQHTWSLRSRSSNSNINININNGDDITTTHSNASTPRLRLRPKTNTNTNTSTNNGDDDTAMFHSSVIDNLNITPRLRCKTNTKNLKSSLLGSNPSSPRSPFSIFKSSLGFSRSNCGLCLQSVKTGHKTAIFTAECSHTFHFPCISQHVKQENTLSCPICKTTWRDASFLAIHRLQSNHDQIHKPTTTTTPTASAVIETRKQLEKPTMRLPMQENIVIKGKAYDDDEPLGTPRAGGIGPIPEAVEVEAEEESKDDEEFQGFFVNPVSSSSSGDDFKSVEVMLMSDVAVISSSTQSSHETYAVVLKVKAPSSSHMVNNNKSSRIRRRAPIDLVAVLDVSASMGGAKLQMLKRAMRLVISSLNSADRLSILAFSAYTKRLLPLRRMHPRGQRSARRIIDHLASTPAPATCAGEALRKATKVLDDRRERNPVATIILLSDYGAHDQENVTSTQPQPAPAPAPAPARASHMSSTRFAHVEIPVHTLEKTGDYSSSNDYENAFTKCVGGLLSVVAQDLRIQLVGSDLAEITAVYTCNGKPMVLNADSVRFGDLYAEEEREVLLELRVPRSTVGSHQVLSARCSYKDPATQELIYGGEKVLLVPRPQSVSSPRIQRLRNLFIATRSVAESRLLVEHNKLTTARHLLSSARALLMQSASAEEFVKGLEYELGDLERRQQLVVNENGASRSAEKLAKVGSLGDLHGFENARF